MGSHDCTLYFYILLQVYEVENSIFNCQSKWPTFPKPFYMYLKDVVFG